MKNIKQFPCSKSRVWMTAAVLAALVAGCGGGGGGSAPGTLGVSLTDAPACGFKEVNVTVAKVRVNQSSTAPDSDGSWIDIPVNRKINLLDLNNGVLDKLGETPLAAGHYTQLRLVLERNTPTSFANSVVLKGGNTEIELVTPSAVQSGIKLVNEFDVASGQRVDLLMDFDACKSIVLRGNGDYALKPVIKIIPFVLNGIKGFVDTALLNSDVMVTAQQGGVVVQTTAPKTNGEFYLARLPAGTYDVVVTANDRSTAVIAGVTVATPTSEVPVSTGVQPITMPVSSMGTVSGMAVLDPASDTELAYVTTKQTFDPQLVGTAPTVTVKSVAADDYELNAGAYSLNLPIGEPLLGQFGTGSLPVTLNMQSGMAGKYSVAASATGYQTTQSFSKDISAVNATQAFVLVP